MLLHNIAFFVHMVGLIALFGGFILMQHGGRKLRSAPTWEGARTWSDFLRPVSGMFAGGALMMLASGAYMTQTLFTFTTPWIACGLAAVVLVMVPGVVVIHGRLAEIRKTAAALQGPISDEGRALLASPSLWGPNLALNFLAFGIIWIMSAKPGWTGSLAIPLTAAVLGLLIGSGLSRPRTKVLTEPYRDPYPRPERTHRLAHGGHRHR